MHKIIFADQLRALAALSVVFVHLGGVYWSIREVVAGRIFAPVLEGPSSRILHLAGTFNFGPFGVSLFFLISGFVIPISLQKLSPGRFLIARTFRIYPTYIVCLSLGLLASAASAWYWHSEFTTPWKSIVLNAALMHNLFSVESIDTVNWTLQVEIKFYIVMAVVAALGGNQKASPLLVTAALVPAAMSMAPNGPTVTALLHDLAFVPYMMIGSIIHMHMSGKLDGRRAVFFTIALAAIFHLTTYFAVLRSLPLGNPLDIYLLNIAFFSLMYLCRDHFKPHPVIDFLATISYPLYAVHPVVGYTLMRILMHMNVPPMLATALASVVAVAVAYGIHVWIELPSSRFGKSLAIRSSQGVSAHRLQFIAGQQRLNEDREPHAESHVRPSARARSMRR